MSQQASEYVTKKYEWNDEQDACVWSHSKFCLKKNLTKERKKKLNLEIFKFHKTFECTIFRHVLNVQVIRHWNGILKHYTNRTWGSIQIDQKVTLW